MFNPITSQGLFPVLYTLQVPGNEQTDQMCIFNSLFLFTDLKVPFHFFQPYPISLRHSQHSCPESPPLFLVKVLDFCVLCTLPFWLKRREYGASARDSVQISPAPLTLATPPYPFTISKMSRDAHPLSWDFLSLKGSRKVPMLALCVEPVYHLPPQGLGLSRFPRLLDHASPGCDFLV